MIYNNFEVKNVVKCISVFQDRKATIGEGGEINSADREAFASFGEEKWRAKFLLKRHIDLEEVLTKCKTYQYRILEEYKADVQNIVHNVVIYHGVHSTMADTARQMFRDCVNDLSEMTTCRDCYRYANTRYTTTILFSCFFHDMIHELNMFK